MNEHRGPEPETRQQLLAATRRAAEAAGEDIPGDAEPPRPGDLYVLPATADFDVEWLVTAPHGDDPARLRVVAAVADPDPGSGDVEVTEEEPGGPLVLRCRHRLWLPAGFLVADLRTGRVAAGRAAEAEARCTALDAGPVVGSPLQRETDDDPEYRRRGEELAAARDALLVAATRWEATDGGGSPGAAGGGTVPAPTDPGVAPQVPRDIAPETADHGKAPEEAGGGEGGDAPDQAGASRPGGPPAGRAGSDPGYAEVSPLRPRRRRATTPTLLRLAASLLLAALGLTAWWGLTLRDDLAASRQPRLEPIPPTIGLGPTRSPDVYEVVRTGEWLRLRLYWRDLPGDRPYRVEIVDPDGGTPLRTEPFVPGDFGDRVLRIHRSQLSPGRYQLRILEVGAASPEPVYEQPIQVPPEEPPEDAGAP